MIYFFKTKNISDCQKWIHLLPWILCGSSQEIPGGGSDTLQTKYLQSLYPTQCSNHKKKCGSVNMIFKITIKKKTFKKISGKMICVTQFIRIFHSVSFQVLWEGVIEKIMIKFSIYPLPPLVHGELSISRLLSITSLETLFFLFNKTSYFINIFSMTPFS